ncbi:hypothetical protein DNHGIG_19570 [Collibacillus ludicampi]|uniref:DUF2269 family protein n=1 Tax=Collibacillus ludicampi TaxID=2771369 RepID=A0AAV4LFG5_9BACL|nr:DUF2269 family protein [Collibacillus ludicampi]GIM46408.1 hypothetical protein DNHGIG_19570 [Collibacillus ludicampi]
MNGIHVLFTLHIVSAVIGIGPIFIYPFLIGSAKTVSQLRFVFRIITKINIFHSIGSTTLIGSGVWLMIELNTGFHMMWLNLSLLLTALLSVIVFLFVAPCTKKMREILKNAEGEEIPQAYYEVKKRWNACQSILYTDILLILILMATKQL